MLLPWRPFSYRGLPDIVEEQLRSKTSVYIWNLYWWSQETRLDWWVKTILSLIWLICITLKNRVNYKLWKTLATHCKIVVTLINFSIQSFSFVLIYVSLLVFTWYFAVDSIVTHFQRNKIFLSFVWIYEERVKLREDLPYFFIAPKRNLISKENL